MYIKENKFLGTNHVEVGQCTECAPQHGPRFDGLNPKVAENRK